MPKTDQSKIITPDVIKIFLDYLDEGDKNECWPWRGSIYKSIGYGMIFCHGKRYLAHRVSILYYIGLIESEYEALHTYDNKICVNWYHLYLGTQADNTDDKRNIDPKYLINPNYGESNGNSRLTNSDVKEIRIMWNQGYTQQKIGNKFGVSHRTIGRIINGETWK